MQQFLMVLLLISLLDTYDSGPSIFLSEDLSLLNGIDSGSLMITDLPCNFVCSIHGW